MQKFTYGAITLFCFVFTFFGFTLKLNHSQSNPAINTTINKNNNNNVENITVVYPNPESNILNLHCNDNFKYPINIKALNDKEIVVKSINSLIAEGSDKFKFVQINTSGMEKGKYTIVMTDNIGKTITRKIYIKK